jgi:site-specific recombinase XerD
MDLKQRLFYIRSKHGTDIASPGIKTYNERTVIMHRECAAALKQYLEDGRPAVSTSALFFTSRGTRLTTRALEDVVGNAARTAGIREGRVYPYLLRHTACTLMCQSNINLQFVSKQMGHKRIEQTLAYSHPSVLAIKDVLDKNFII